MPFIWTLLSTMRMMNNFPSDEPMELIPHMFNGISLAKKNGAELKAQDSMNKEQGAVQEQNCLPPQQEVVEPSTTTDVVLGRGGFEGSIFKNVIESHAKQYLQSKHTHKSVMIFGIYEELKNRKCRFIAKTNDSKMVSKFIIVTDEHRITNRIKRSMRSFLRKEHMKEDAMKTLPTTVKEESSNKRKNESCPADHDQSSNKRQCCVKETSLKTASSNSSKFPSIIGEEDLLGYYNDPLPDCESIIMGHEQDSWRPTELKESVSFAKFTSASSMDSFSFPDLKFTDSLASIKSMSGGRTTLFATESTPHPVPQKNKFPAVRKVSILEHDRSLSTQGTNVGRDVSPVGVVDFPASSSTTAPPPKVSGTVSPDHNFMSISLQKESVHSPAPRRNENAVQTIKTPSVSPQKKKKTPAKKSSVGTSSSSSSSQPPHQTRRPSGPSPVSLQVLPCFGRNNPAPLAPKLPTSKEGFSEFFHQFMQLEEKAKALEDANAAMYQKLLALEHSMDAQLTMSTAAPTTTTSAMTTTPAFAAATAAAASYPYHRQHYYHEHHYDDNNNTIMDSYGVAAPAGPTEASKPLLLPEEAAAWEDACMLQGIFDDVDDVDMVDI